MDGTLPPLNRTLVTFQLPDHFILRFSTVEPAWGALGYVTYKRTYARKLIESDRWRDIARKAGIRVSSESTEEWWITVARVVEGTFQFQEWHCLQHDRPWNELKARRAAQEMYELIFSFKFLPPGRGLWMMGTDYIWDRGSAALNNCAFITTQYIDQDFARPFTWAMDMLMLGAGVGFDVRGANKLEIQKPSEERLYHRVQDSREGWVEILSLVLNAYVGQGKLPHPDYADVRTAGAALKGFGGTSAGPGPLIELLDSVQTLLDQYIGRTLDSVGIVDLKTLIGRCVVAGNLRRSALLSLGAPSDQQFLSLKDPETAGDALWHHRWAANNSILADVGMDYSQIGKQTAKNGEPGYIWLENARQFGRLSDPASNIDRDAMGVNPCAEQVLFSGLTSQLDPSGRPSLGGEMCTLVESFPAHHASYTEFARTLKFAYLYAKTVTLIPTHDSATNEIMRANRRIGCSMAGIVQAIQRHGMSTFYTWCDDGYKYLGNVDAIYSDWLGIPKSIKRTSVKPGGSVPLLVGATPGMHFPESEYYWRVIRFATNSPMVPRLIEAGYPTYDLEPGEPNTTAVYFPVKEKWFDRGKRNVTMWEQIEIAAMLQAVWADNAVSATITFDPDREAHEIPRALAMFDRRLKGVSFLPTRDHGYAHAPYQPISREQYETAVQNLRPLVLVDSHEVTERFCDGDKCEIGFTPKAIEEIQ